MLKNVFYLILLITINISFSNAQSFWKRYDNTSGGERHGLTIQTSEGEFIITGTTGVPPLIGSTAFYIIKTDYLGDTLWTLIINEGNSHTYEGLMSLPTFDDGLIVSGIWDGNDYILIKLDNNLSISWATRIHHPLGAGGISDAWAQVVQTYDSGFVILGVNDVNTTVNKVDKNGNILWNKEVNSLIWNSPCGIIIETNNHDLIFPVACRNSMGTNDLSIIKTDSNGNLIWTKNFDLNVGSSIRRIFEDPVGNLIFTCGMSLIKLDLFGDTLWTKSYDFGFSVIGSFDTCGLGYIITGDVQDSNGIYSVLIKTDSFGNPIWTRRFIQLDMVRETDNVNKTIDGGFVISGTLADDEFVSNYELFLLKVDSNGFHGCNIDTTPIQEINSPLIPISFPTTIDPISLTAIPLTPMIFHGALPSIYCFPTAVLSNETDSYISLYPNPSANKVFINSIDNICQVDVYNLFGFKVLSISNEGNSLEIYFRNLQRGVYFAHISTSKKTSQIYKILIQ